MYIAIAGGHLALPAFAQLCRLCNKFAMHTLHTAVCIKLVRMHDLL